MGILLLGALTLLLWVPEYRKFFVRPGPYLGCLLAALVFLPNVLWNVNNEFVSLKHTAEISKFGTDLHRTLPVCWSSLARS
ncbi:MAG: hypothetical protein CM15mP120_20120 [Pseudomonadota bacterium]|nr:MAG: hypothetical protein CM15mP120_20120 [Pseudomonadota bacterium]